MCNLRIFIIAIVLLVSNVLQSTLFNVIRIRDISPNFMVMIIVAFALLRGSREGSIIGFFSGLLTDILFSTSKGYLAIIGACIGYFCGKLNKDFYRENFILPFLLTLVSTIAYDFALSFAFLLRGKTNYIFFIKNIIVPETIYTMILSVVVYQLMYIINEKIEKHEKVKRNIFEN